jgi:hypothetical protein
MGLSRLLQAVDGAVEKPADVLSALGDFAMLNAGEDCRLPDQLLRSLLGATVE